MRPVQPKSGKSKRGQFTKAQSEYIDRAVQFGCLACFLSRGIEGVPAQYHHQKSGWHGAGMRAPHEFGIALCREHHTDGRDSIHRNPRGFEALTGKTEAELVSLSQRMFNWPEPK